MGTKAKDVIVNNDMLKEYEEKLAQATTDEERGAIENEYLKKVYKEKK